LGGKVGIWNQARGLVIIEPKSTADFVAAAAAAVGFVAAAARPDPTCLTHPTWRQSPWVMVGLRVLVISTAPPPASLWLLPSAVVPLRLKKKKRVPHGQHIKDESK
jgi:hypothetical protein